jgi:carbon-monoxide dehydrogenase small subunit
MKITITLNGLKKELHIRPDDYLLDVLRENGCPSVRRGCDTGSCGVCTVLMDGIPVLSCAMLTAKADGHEITTAEGMQEEIRRFAEFLAAEGAEQCGYCSPGLALTVLAMKQELENPDEAQIRRYLTGNLCRCSGYEGQLRAIRRFMEVRS